MAISFVEGFDDYISQTTQLKKRPWWRRLLRPRRPPAKLYVCFFYKSGEWHQAEAAFETPESTELVEVRLACYKDGVVMHFDSSRHCIAEIGA